MTSVDFGGGLTTGISQRPDVESFAAFFFLSLFLSPLRHYYSGNAELSDGEQLGLANLGSRNGRGEDLVY